MAQLMSREQALLDETPQESDRSISSSLLSYLITEEDSMDAGKELRRARRARGFTVRKLAELGGTSAAAISQIETGARGVTVERLQSLLLKTRHRLISIPTLASTPNEVSENIKAALEKSTPQLAYRLFIGYSDVLRQLEPGVRVAITISRPETTGNRLYDACIAALVQHWLLFDSLPVPSWVSEEGFILSEPTHLGETSYESAPNEQEVPEAFLLHNVLFPAEALESI
jgi:transcriptional regulator with XRE-family HTH domain